MSAPMGPDITGAELRDRYDALIGDDQEKLDAFKVKLGSMGVSARSVNIVTMNASHTAPGPNRISGRKGHISQCER